MHRKLILPVAVAIVLAAAAVLVIRSGVLTVPTAAELQRYTPVESRDILVDQFQREQDILSDYSAAPGSYTPESPYVIQDPYQANPLSALILFETALPAQVTVMVQGKEAATAYSYSQGVSQSHHEIAVLGLYPDWQNTVTLDVVEQNGSRQSFVHQIQTEPLPYDFPALDVQVSKPAQMEPGLILMIPCFDTSYTYLLDDRGEVRAYFSNRNFGHGSAVRVLQNGHLLATSDVMKMMPYNMYGLWEFNLLGKVFAEYEVPNAIHHDVIELTDGDFLAVSNNAGMPINYDTREDVIVRIDRQTGLVEEEYDLRQILDEHRDPYQHFDPGVVNALNRDWAHLNSMVMDESSNSLIVSSPIQSAVVKFDAESKEIDWLLSSPEGWDGEFTGYQKYLLEPVGDNFEWQWGQHAVSILNDQDNNPDTLDLLVFDNGQSRSYDAETAVAPADNYSRAVIYRINEVDRTVEQLWQYGKERGSQAYATFLGDANLLPVTGNIEIAFGGMLRSDGVPVDDIVMGVLGQQQVQSRVVEVTPAGEPVFDVTVTPQNSSASETYQITRMALDNTALDYLLGQVRGVRLGATQSAQPMEYQLPGFFVPRMTFNFKQAYEKNGYLILQGNFLYEDKAYMLGRLLFVLKNEQHTYIYPANPGLNGNFYIRIDLSELEPGDYAIYGAGGVVEGLDASGKLLPAYNPTGYKITVQP